MTAFPLFAEPPLSPLDNASLDAFGERQITKKDVFNYTYAVLHDPVYRERYAANLRREFPRVPFYGNTLGDFAQWALWGQKLMMLHADFEAADPYPLERLETGRKPKVRLRADREAGIIDIDSATRLEGVPGEAWGYVLGGKPALEWVLERYRERTPKDETVARLFNAYRFADHKEAVIELLRRVTTVSVETVRVQRAMVREGVR